MNHPESGYSRERCADRVIWEKSPKSAKEIENKEVAERIKEIFDKSRRVYGSRKIRKELARLGKHMNHKRI